MNNKNRGVTLIEVIIAVIAIGLLFLMFHMAFEVSSGNVNAATSPTVQGTNIPEPTNYAVDTTGKVSAADWEKLNAKLKALDDGNRQIGVLMVDTTSPLSIDEYGIRVGEKWKVGNKGTDNGVIIIVAVNDRKVRVEVGKGMEGSLNDAKAGQVRDSMTPFFKIGDWVGGLNVGIDQIVALSK